MASNGIGNVSTANFARNLIHFIVPLLLLTIALPTPARAENTSAADAALNTGLDGLDGLYGMTNTFLGQVVQPRDLTYIASKLKIEKISDLMDMNKIAAEKMTLVTYGIGFAVCVAIGVIAIVVMLVACCCFPCCRCCGNCGGGKDPMERGKKRKSHCCFVVTGIVLLVITLMLIAVNITMYCTSGRLHQHLTSGLFTDIESGLNGMDRFLGGVVDQMNASVLDKYIAMETKLLGKLDAVPSAAMDMLNNETGVRTTLDGLSAFTANLPELNSTLHETSALAAQLNDSTEQLWQNFVTIEQNLLAKMASCNPACTSEINLVKSTQIAVNFSAVDLAAATLAVEEAIRQNMSELIRSSQRELDKVENDVNNTMASTIVDITGNCKDGENQIRDMLVMFSDVLNGFSLSSFLDMVSGGKDMIKSYSLYIKIAFLALCVYMTLILAMNLLGLLFGATLRQRKATDGKCCRCDRWVASHFMLTSAALTFLFFWLYMFIVVLTFLLGGLMQTEFCRHVVNFDDPKSVKVLDLVDGWINGTVAVPNVELLPFGMYRECSKPEVTIYKALKLEKNWNLTSMINTAQMDQAIKDLKAKDFSVPQVNLTNDLLRDLLLNLDATVGRLDFQYMNGSVDGPITNPEISALITPWLFELDLRDNNINISTEIQELRDLITSSVTPISTGRDALMKLLYKDQWLIGQTSFKASADNLQTSQDTINTNGTVIVSRFVNTTADEIYSDVTNFTRGTVAAVENDVARCQPMHNSMKTLLEAICVRTLYPLNGFWFAIGWCLAFLVPGLILAVQLASVYRYPSGQNSVGHSDDADTIEAAKASSSSRLPPLLPAETHELTSEKTSGQLFPPISPVEKKHLISEKTSDQQFPPLSTPETKEDTHEKTSGQLFPPISPVEKKELTSEKTSDPLFPPISPVGKKDLISEKTSDQQFPPLSTPETKEDISEKTSGQLFPPILPVEKKELTSEKTSDQQFPPLSTPETKEDTSEKTSGQLFPPISPVEKKELTSEKTSDQPFPPQSTQETKELTSEKTSDQLFPPISPVDTKELTSEKTSDQPLASSETNELTPEKTSDEAHELTSAKPPKIRTRKKNKVHAAPPEEIGSSEA